MLLTPEQGTAAKYFMYVPVPDNVNVKILDHVTICSQTEMRLEMFCVQTLVITGQYSNNKILGLFFRLVASAPWRIFDL